MSEKDKLLVSLVKEVLKKRKRRKRAKRAKKSKNNDNYVRQNRESQEMPRGYIVNQGDNRFNPAVMANNNFSNELRMQNDILQQNTRKMIEDRVNDLNQSNQHNTRQITDIVGMANNLNKQYQQRFTNLENKTHILERAGYDENDFDNYGQNQPPTANNNNNNMLYINNGDEHTSTKDPYFGGGAVVTNKPGEPEGQDENPPQQPQQTQQTNPTPQIPLPNSQNTSNKLITQQIPSTPSTQAKYSPQIVTNSSNPNKIIQNDAIPVKESQKTVDERDGISVDGSQNSIDLYDPFSDDDMSFDYDAYFDLPVKIKPSRKASENVSSQQVIADSPPNIPKSPKKEPKTPPPTQLVQSQKVLKKEKAIAVPKDDVFIEDVEDEKPVKVKKQKKSNKQEKSDDVPKVDDIPKFIDIPNVVDIPQNKVTIEDALGKNVATTKDEVLDEFFTTLRESITNKETRDKYKITEMISAKRPRKYQLLKALRADYREQENNKKSK